MHLKNMLRVRDEWVSRLTPYPTHYRQFRRRC